VIVVVQVHDDCGVEFIRDLRSLIETYDEEGWFEIKIGQDLNDDRDKART